MKIENEDLWQKIREGELKGLSIEGYFVDKLEKMTKTYTDEEIQTAYKELQAEGKIQKVDLGVVDDLQKELNKSDKILKDMSKLSNKKDSVVNKINSLVKENDKLANKGRTIEKEGSDNLRKLGLLREKINKSAKDLGIDINKIPEYKQSLKMVEKIKSADFGSLGGKIDITFIEG